MSALALSGLSVAFASGDPAHPVSAVDNVTFSIENGEIFGLVGESGCGKSTLANAIMGLLPSSARISGSVMLDNRELVGLDDQQLRSLRGNEMSMIFQDASASLDPTWPVGDQVAETIRAHRTVSRREARESAIRLMTDVGIPAARARYSDAPHRLSGGMRQRIVIAAALANNPQLLVADEPTTALDVTIQAQILELLRRMRSDENRAIMIITHDLGVVAQLCDRVGVMYGGQLVELASVTELFRNPRHPYTRALLAASPGSGSPSGRLADIPGQVPDLAHPPLGCRFSTRCARKTDECDVTPTLATAGGDSLVACWNPLPIGSPIAKEVA